MYRELFRNPFLHFQISAQIEVTFKYIFVIHAEEVFFPLVRDNTLR